LLKEGRLVINKFKTSYMFPPYDVKLKPGTATLVREFIAKQPRKYLVGKVSLSKILKRAFNAVGLDDVDSVMDIRHSMLTHMLNGNASLAHVTRVAKKFKHDVKTALAYVRVTKSGNDS
jgi:site-specific recombinase XerD